MLSKFLNMNNLLTYYLLISYKDFVTVTVSYNCIIYYNIVYENDCIVV